jgi:hypothetical protein
MIKGQQIGQILFQSMNQAGISGLPAPPKLLESRAGLLDAVGIIDHSRISRDGFDVQRCCNC